MKRKIITTGDGSSTIYLEDWNEHYHSKHGAIQEAYHVFLKQGLFPLQQTNCSILEMGFGTGLNAFITFLEARKNKWIIDYVGVEAFPVAKNELSYLNYVELLNETHSGDIFTKMHDISWNETHQLSSFFKLEKQQKDFFEIDDKAKYNLIYFDAFGPRVQPELWTAQLFKKMFAALVGQGVLVTYSAKGSVRRALQEVGFIVERLQGPPGKREMLRAKRLT